MYNDKMNMKFNVVVGNPPFSKVTPGKMHGKGGIKLYRKFFEKSLKLANIVAMVLPSSERKVEKDHNSLLKQHANIIKHIDRSMFPSIEMPMWYVICNNTGDKPDIDWSIVESDNPQNNINWIRGPLEMTSFKKLSGNFGDSKPKHNDDITIYHKVNKTHGLVTKYGRKKHVPEKSLFPKSGYAVLMPQCFGDKGWSQVEIVECNGRQSAFNGMNIVFTKNKKQAERLVDYMKTPSFITQANKVKQGFNEMTIPSFRSIKIDQELFSDF